MMSRETDAPTGIHIACQTLIVCITGEKKIQEAAKTTFHPNTMYTKMGLDMHMVTRQCLVR